MSEETKACPYCTETIKAEDIICPYCGKKDLIQPVATEREPLRRPRRILLILGAIGLIYGAFLPWATIYTFYGSFNLAAFPGYRMFSGGVGLLLLLVAIFAKPQRNKRYTTAATILATIALLIIATNIPNISKIAVSIATPSSIPRAGIGIYLSILAAVVAIIGGLQVLLREK